MPQQGCPAQIWRPTARGGQHRDQVLRETGATEIYRRSPELRSVRFHITMTGVYDAVSQIFRAFVSGLLGNNANNTVVAPTGVFLATAVTPDKLTFTANYQFSNAPQSGTTVQIHEMVM